MTSPDEPDPSPQPDWAAAPPSFPYGQPQYGSPQYGLPGGYLVPSQHDGANRPLPGTVIAASVLLYVFAGFSLLVAFFFLFLTSTLNRSGTLGHAIGAVSATAGVVFLALATADVVLAILLRKGSRTARVITVIVSGLFILGGLAQHRGSSLLSVALGGVMIYLLIFNAEAKRFFADRTH